MVTITAGTLTVVVMTTVMMGIIHTENCPKLDLIFWNYTSCPYPESEAWNNLKMKMNCTGDYVYHCASNSQGCDVQLCMKRVYCEAGNRPLLDPDKDTAICAPCPPDRYQKTGFWSNERSYCEHEKTQCNGNGQIECQPGSATTDRSCRCNIHQNLALESYALHNATCCTNSDTWCYCVNFISPCRNGTIRHDNYKCLDECPPNSFRHWDSETCYPNSTTEKVEMTTSTVKNMTEFHQMTRTTHQMSTSRGSPDTPVVGVVVGLILVGLAVGLLVRHRRKKLNNGPPSGEKQTMLLKEQISGGETKYTQISEVSEKKNLGLMKPLKPNMYRTIYEILVHPNEEEATEKDQLLQSPGAEAGPSTKGKIKVLRGNEISNEDTVAIDTNLPVMETTGIPSEPKRKGRDYCENKIPTVEKQQSMSRTDQIFPNDRGKDETKQRTCPEFMSTNKMQYCEAEEYVFDIPFKELHPVKSGTDITKVRILNETVSHKTGNCETSLMKEMDTLLVCTEAPRMQQTMSDASVTACVSDELNSSYNCINEQGEICSNDELAKPSYTRTRKQYCPKLRRTITCHRNIKFFKGKVEKKRPKRLFKVPLPLGNDAQKMIPNKNRDSKRGKRMAVVEAKSRVISWGKKTGSFEWMTSYNREDRILESYYQSDKQVELDVCQQSIQSSVEDNLISSNDHSFGKPSVSNIQNNVEKTDGSEIQIVDMNSGEKITQENEQNGHKSSAIFGSPNENRNEISSFFAKNENVSSRVEITQFKIERGNSNETDQVCITPMAFTAFQNESKLENSSDYGVYEQKMSEVQRPQSFTKGSTNESLLAYENGCKRSAEDKNGIERSDNHKDENLCSLSTNRDKTFHGGKDDHKLIENQTEMQERTCPDKYGRIQNVQEYHEGRDKSAEEDILDKEKRNEPPLDDEDFDESTPELQMLQSENGTGTVVQYRKNSNKSSDCPISQTQNLGELSDTDRDVDNNPECRNLETTIENKPLFINKDASDRLAKHLSLESDSKWKRPTNKEREDQVTTEKQILEREGRQAFLSCNEEHVYVSADKPREINRTLMDIDETNISSEKCESGKGRVSHAEDASVGSSSFMDAVKYAIKNGDDSYIRQYLETQAWEHEDEIPLYFEYSLAFQDSDGIPTITMVFLSWICMELTKKHEPYTVTVWPARLPGEDRFQELPFLVCNYWDDVKEIYRDRCFFGLTVKYKEYNTVNDEEQFVQNSKEFLESKLSISDAILANEIVSQNADWLMNSHSSLEVIKPCHVRIIRSEVFYETCIVLYCRSKGYIPFHENLFPTTLTFQKISLPVDVREGFFVPAMMQENSSFTNAGGNKETKPASDEEAWDHDLFRMGISMGPFDKPISATVGPFVRIGENDVGFLTCAHAFGIPCNVDSVVKQEVVSPANEECAPIHRDDFIPIHNVDPICGHVDKIRFDNDPKHHVNVDAALIRLVSNKQPRKGRFPWMKPSDLEQAGLTRGQILKYDDGKIVKKTTIEQGELTSGKFIKVGAASGVTSSNYLGHEQAVIKFRQVANLAHEHGNLYPPIIGGTRYYVMKGQYIIYSNFRKNFIALGDSGSGVFHMDDQRKLGCIGIGIGFMNYGREAVVTPIEDVLKALELREDALMTFSLAPTAATMEDEDHESN